MKELQPSFMSEQRGAKEVFHVEKKVPVHLTVYERKPYARTRPTMVDTEFDQEQGRSSSRTQKKENITAETLRTQYDAALWECLLRLRKADLKEMPEEEKEKKRTELTGLIKKVRKEIKSQTGSKNARSELLLEAEKFKKEKLPSPSKLRRLLRVIKNSTQSKDDLKALWYSQYSEKELRDPHLRSTIETAVKLGHKPNIVTSKGVLQQTTTSVHENAQIRDEEERKEKAAELIKKLKEEQAKDATAEIKEKEKQKDLTEEQKEAVITAHKIGDGQMGEDGQPAGVYNYTFSQLRKKAEALRGAPGEELFTKEQRRALIEAGIAGKEKDDSSEEKKSDDSTETFTGSSAPRIEKLEEIDSLVSSWGGIRSPQDVAKLKNAISSYATSHSVPEGADWDHLKRLTEMMQTYEDIYDAELYKRDQERRAAQGSPLRQFVLPGGENIAYDPTNERLYRGTPTQRILERMARIRGGKDTYTDSDRRTYYKEMKRYINDVIRNVEVEETLSIPEEDLRKFKDIFEDNADKLTMDEIEENTKILQNKLSLQDYFENLVPMQREQQQGYLPNDVEELMELIASSYNDYRVGADFQLIDVNGDVHVENFLHWVRDRMWEQDDGQPNSTNLDLLSAVNIQSVYQPISLLNIVLLDRYTRTSKIILKGKVTESDDGKNILKNVIGQHSEPKAHPDFETNKFKFLTEAWLMSLNHNYDAQYRQIRGQESEVPKAMQQFFRNNDFGKDYNLFKPFLFAGTDHEDFKLYAEYNAQGNVGKAIQKMLLSYYYLAEFAEPELYPLNMFKKVMGEKGINTMYLSMAADALNEDADAKKSYQEYVLALLEKQKEEYRGDSDYAMVEREINKKIKDVKERDLSQTQDTSMFQAFSKKPSAIEQPVKFEIRLDDLPDLVALKTQIFKKRTGQEATKEKKDEIRGEVKRILDNTLKRDYLDQLNGKYKLLIEKKDPHDEKRTLYDVRDVDFTTFGQNNEKFALDLVKSVMGYNKKQLNFFNAKKPEEKLVKMVQKAIKNGTCNDMDISESDTKYAGMWTQRFLNWTGVAARNDVVGTGFDAWAKLINFESYRTRQFEERTQAGNLHNLPGIKSLSMTLWDALSVRYDSSPISLDDVRAIEDPHERALKVAEYKKSQNKTFLQILQGGEGSTVDLKEPILRGELPGLALQDFADTHLANAFKLMSLIDDEVDIHLNGVVAEDNEGKIVVDQKKLQQILDAWWKSIRYTYDQYGFDYNQKIVYKGKEMSVRDYFFNEDVQNMHMYDYRPELYGKYKNEDGSDKRMARNVWAYLIGKEIEAHIVNHRHHPRWSYTEIYKLRELLKLIGVTVAVEEHGNSAVGEIEEGQFTNEEFDGILKMVNTSMGKMRFNLYSTGILSSVFAALFNGGKLMLKEIKPAA